MESVNVSMYSDAGFECSVLACGLSLLHVPCNLTQGELDLETRCEMLLTSFCKCDVCCIINLILARTWFNAILREFLQGVVVFACTRSM